jgi:hypothetical protein
VVLITGAASGGASAPGQQPPLNVTPPSISGNAQVGSLLTAAPGTWKGKALKYAYQWLRCDSSGASCSAITGARTQTYSLSTADAGATARVIVTATNRNGSAAATSAATGVISTATTGSPSAGTSPSNTSPPTISGTAQQGQTLTASTGSWSGTTPISYAYQWQRCDSAGASCVPVVGASGSSYLLAAADVGSTMRVSVTANNSAGSATASSLATALVTAPPNTTNSVQGQVLWRNGFDNGTIDGGFGPGCNGTFTIDFSVFASSPASGRFDVSGSSNRCELYYNNHPIGNHVDAYYAFSLRVPTDWNDNSNEFQLGMESINGAPIGINATATNGVWLQISSGSCGTIGSGLSCGYWTGNPVEGWVGHPSGFDPNPWILPQGQLTHSVWHQFIVHIYWTTSLDGHIEAWHKTLGGSTWTKTYDYGPAQYAFPTLQTGQQSSQCGGGIITADNVATWTNCISEIEGIYAGGGNHWYPPVTSWIDDFCRATTFDAAVSCLA